MGDTTKIQWTDHTFNGWLGCEKVSAGCRGCYAEVATPVRVHRKHGLELWGKGAARHVTSDDNWKKPLAWNRTAQVFGFRARVFAHSLSDVFEARDDLDAPRARLFSLIEATPWLDWLLLTKRPEEMVKRAPASWARAWPANAWAGCTVENQEMAEERIPHLLRVPAAVRFLSCEPLLEELNIDPPTCGSCGGHEVVLGDDGATPFCPEHEDEMGFNVWLDPCADADHPGINWVIVGGESGTTARPFDLAWARAIRDQCAEAGVPCFVKQLGARAEDASNGIAGRFAQIPDEALPLVSHRLKDAHGGDMDEWPVDLRVRQLHVSPTAKASSSSLGAIKVRAASEGRAIGAEEGQMMLALDGALTAEDRARAARQAAAKGAA